MVFFVLYGWLSGLLVGIRLVEPVSSQSADQTATHTEQKGLYSDAHKTQKSVMELL